MTATASNILAIKVSKILQNNLPVSAWKEVAERTSMFKEPYIRIMFAANDHAINNVSGQFPQCVSLRLDVNSLELDTQVYGGNGGGVIYRKPNLKDPKEKYLAMKNVKVPFRKPKKTEQATLKAVERFCQRWVQTLKDNRDVLKYQDIVDYDTLLS